MIAWLAGTRRSAMGKTYKLRIKDRSIFDIKVP